MNYKTVELLRVPMNCGMKTPDYTVTDPVEPAASQRRE